MSIDPLGHRFLNGTIFQVLNKRREGAVEGAPHGCKEKAERGRRELDQCTTNIQGTEKLSTKKLDKPVTKVWKVGV